MIPGEKILLLSNWIDQAQSVCTVCHARPDGDALGCSAAVYFYLRSLGKDVTVLLPDAPTATLSFLMDGVHYLTPQDGAEAALSRCELLLCLDFNTLSRTEPLEQACRSFSGRKVLADHHKAPVLEEFDLAFSAPESSSACEVMFDVLMSLPGVDGNAARLPERCAYALMTGMTTDTNNFANSVGPGTLEMASALLAAGVDREDIIDRLFRSGRAERLHAMGDIILNRMVLSPQGAAITVLTKDVLDSYALQDGEYEGFVNIPLEIKEIRLSIFVREEGGQLRVSIRSKRGTSARALAIACFHGGGHEQASGGKILIPEDVPSASAAAAFVAENTARFLQGQDATEQ
ncbi:MAG: DHH family phosphoesterase [Bacteroidales bacterium]|nr:DHH family phosphoesterase [Bacteroidales bacterium]